jgi:hypothetical protein
LQSKYSISWKCEKQKGASAVKMVRSQMLDSYEEYDFIDTFNTHQGNAVVATPSPTLQSATNNRNRNRKSIALKQSIMKNGRKLIYTAEWELAFDLVLEFDLTSGDHKEKLLKVDIIEHRGNDNQTTVGTVTINLVEFTSPPPIFSMNSTTLKRVVLIPVTLQTHKRAKLKLTVSSLWIKMQQQQTINTQRNRIDPYFILDESEENFSPRSPNTNTFNHHSSPNAKMTPRALTKRTMLPIREIDFSDQTPESPSKLKDRDSKISDTINKRHDAVSESVSMLKQTLGTCEKQIDSLFKRLELLEAEKLGHCRMSPLVSSIANLRCVIFCDLHDGGQLWSLMDSEMIECLNVYYDIMKGCMKDFFGVEIKAPVQENSTDEASDTIICAFESTRMAVQFASTVHTRLLNVEWPQSLLKLRGMVIKDAGTEEDLCLYRGLRCRMGMDIVEQDGSLFESVRRATIIARYASGGHTLLSDKCMKQFQFEEDKQKEKMDIVIQELSATHIDGVGHDEKMSLVVPKRLAGRLYAQIEEGKLPVMESALVNDLYARLDGMQNTMDSVVRTKMRELDNEFFKVNSLMDLFKQMTKEGTDVAEVSFKEMDKKHLALQSSLEVIKKETIANMQRKIQQFEIEALKLNMAIISQFSMGRKRGMSSVRGTSSPMVSPRNMEDRMTPRLNLNVDNVAPSSPRPSPSSPRPELSTKRFVELTPQGSPIVSPRHVTSPPMTPPLSPKPTSQDSETALSAVLDHNAYMSKKLEDLKKLQQQMELRMKKEKPTPVPTETPVEEPKIDESVPATETPVENTEAQTTTTAPEAPVEPAETLEKAPEVPTVVQETSPAPETPVEEKPEQ